jgi:cell division protein FtsW
VSRIKLKKQKNNFDKRLLALTLVLTGIGLIAVADASYPQALNYFSDKLYFVKQQAVWALIGIIALFVASKVHYSFWEKISLPLFVISLGFLFLVLLPGIGIKTLGARRWMSLGPVNFQPSEVVKLTLAIYLAKVTAAKKRPLSFFLPLVIIVGLIMKQPDLGTALIVSFIGIIQIFIAGVNFFYIVGAIFLGIALGIPFVLFSDYRRARLMTFLKITQDPLDKAYHIRQVLLALGSGGLFGVGLGQSRQKYLFLPEAATDSIFAIIAEELGFIGASLLIFLFVWFIIRGIRIAKNAPDSFSQVLAVGIVSWIGGQAFLNIGSMVALIPLTGVPLPFLSYGGSALTMTLLSCGILLNISRHAKKQK